tara:strand:- start:1435 stop:1710 length:276 start_codon:yes stop_codon:yes gene_type:complete
MGSLIIFSVMIDAYALMTFSSVLDEAWNCANPRPYPKEKYNVCQWSESDLINHKGEWILKPRDKDDNFIEKKVRKVYWRKRGYDVTKIRFK